MPEMTSAYLAALTLLLYLIGRAAVPFFLLDRPKGLSGSALLAISSMVSCIAYVIVPSVIGSSAYGSPKFTWNLFGFIICKSVAGCAFAVQTTCFPSVVISENGSGTNYQMLAPIYYVIGGIGGALGPISGFIITFARYYDGMSFAEAFHLQFYINSGVAGAVTLINGYLWIQLRRAQQIRKEQEEACSSQTI